MSTTWSYSDLKSTWEIIKEITGFDSHDIKYVLSEMINESKDFEI